MHSDNEHMQLSNMFFVYLMYVLLVYIIVIAPHVLMVAKDKFKTCYVKITSLCSDNLKSSSYVHILDIIIDTN